MPRRLASLVFMLSGALLCAQTPAPPAPDATFDVATIKPVEHDPQGGRFFRIESPRRWVVKDYTLKLLIAAAYDLNPKTISGGPAWIESQHFDINALTPESLPKPTRTEQMAMLRHLLTDRFQLTFHREPREFSLYELTLAKDGPKLKPSATPDAQPQTISTVYPQKIVMPARNASMADFTAVLQRALLDRPVVDKTGLTGRYDFDLEWAPDETQFGGEVPVAKDDAPSPPFFTAIQQQLGLKLIPTHGTIDALIIDHASQPTPN